MSSPHIDFPGTVLPLLFFLLASPGSAQEEPCPVPVKTSSAAPGDLFGCAVSSTGDVLVAGALATDLGGRDSGSVHLFSREGARWTPVDEFVGDETGPEDEFGYSVASATGPGGGDTLFVVAGAPFESAAGLASGAAYVFRCERLSCRQEARFTASLPAAQAQFGFSVALDGGQVAVGAPGGSGPGAVEVFERRAGTWVSRSIPPPEGVRGFGLSLALSAGRLLVGAPLTNVSTGAAYVYELEGDTWAQLPSPALAAGDLFGFAVALDGETATVGAPGRGTAHVFLGEGMEWRQDGGPLTGDSRSGRFGVSMALAGDRLLVGARAEDAAYVFQRQEGNGARWTRTARLEPPAPGVDFGLGTALAGDVAFVGAFKDDAWARDSGAVYASFLDAEGQVSCEPVVSPSVSNLRLSFGADLATVCPGDVVTFDLQLENQEELTQVEGVSVGVSLPDIFDRVEWECSESVESCPPNDERVVTRQISLEPNETATITATATVTDGTPGQFEATATLTLPAGVTDPDEDDNGPITVDVNRRSGTRLELTKTSAEDSVVAGNVVTYTLNVANGGPCSAVDLSLDDSPEPGLRLMTISRPCRGGFPCDLPELPPGDMEIEVTFEVDPALITPETLVNVAELTGPGDPLRDEAALDVTHEAGLSLGLTGPEKGFSGDGVTYTVLLVNAGPSSLVDGLVELSLEDVMGPVLSERIDVSPGGIFKVSRSGTLVGDFGDVVVTATVSDPLAVSEPSLTDSVRTFVLPVAPVGRPGSTVAGTLEVSSRRGRFVTYRLLLLNGGPAGQPDNPGPEFVDDLPDELRLLGASVKSDGMDMDGLDPDLDTGVVTWNGSIPAEEWVEIEIRAAIVGAGPGAEICNQGEIFFDPDHTGLNAGRTLTTDPEGDHPEMETCFEIPESVFEIPALSTWGTLVLALLFAGGGWLTLRLRARA